MRTKLTFVYMSWRDATGAVEMWGRKCQKRVMDLKRYDTLPPDVGESKKDYCFRLQEIGHEEMFIRKALAYHFHVQLFEFGAFFNDFELARLRHLTMLRLLAPGRNEFSMVKKVSKNLGISEELAKRWVIRHQEVGDVTYIGIESLTAK